MRNTVSIIHFSAFGIFHIKDIVVMEDVQYYFEKRFPIYDSKEKEIPIDDYEEFKEKNEWLFG